MVMRPISSSNLNAVGFENGTMRILFNSGGLYEYYNVPDSTYRGLMSAGSAGSYFHAFIKGRYSESRIG